MLKSLTIRNCHSFRNEATFSMEAVPGLKDRMGTVAKVGTDKNPLQLNLVGAIYGANAGGKTNLLRALKDVTENIFLGTRFLRNVPFLLTKILDEPFEHRLVVVLDDCEFDYKYTGHGLKVLSEVLKTRHISAGTPKETVVFERVGSKITDTMHEDTSDIFAVVSSAAKSPNLLVLRSAGEMGLMPFRALYDWCASVAYSMNVQSKSEQQNALDDLASELLENENRLKKLNDFIVAFDPTMGDAIAQRSSDITKKSSDEHADMPTAGGDRALLYIAHENKSENEAWYMPTHLESNGTLRMLSLYPKIAHSLEHGTLLVCDELDVMLHPTVFAQIIANYQNKSEINTKNAQLIFTTHNTIVLNRETLRRDAITFVDKDEDGSSRVFRLSDVEGEDGNKIRSDASYDKLYIAGMLGATPETFRNAWV